MQVLMPPNAPGAVRALLAFYCFPQRYAHPAWSVAALGAMLHDPRAGGNVVLPVGSFTGCLDYRRIGRFTAALDLVFAQDSEADDAEIARLAQASGTSKSPLHPVPVMLALTAAQRAVVMAGAPLLRPGFDLKQIGSGADGQLGARCVIRCQALQTPATAARLRLLLPPGIAAWDLWPTSTSTLKGVDVDPSSAQRLLPGLDRVWKWGVRQCFW